MSRPAAVLAVAALAVAGASFAQAPAPAAPHPLPTFTRVTEQAGITWTRSFGDHKLDNIVEGTGSGACVFDYDGDGLLDVYFPNGRWDRAISDNRGRDLIGTLRNALYRNKGDFTFEDVTERAGVAGTGFGFGCSAADVDGDGHVDLYVLNYGKNELFRNNGDGTFTEMAEALGLADARWSLNAAWLDYDRDGDLDVFVTNYLEYDEGKFRSFYAAAGYPGPLSYNGVSCALYRNDGGRFTDVTREAGVENPGGRGMSSIAADLDNDGWMDLYVANDAMENYYYENRGDGTFEEKALLLGLALGQNGQGVSSMGPTVADLDGDGWLDIMIPDMDYGSLLSRRGEFYSDLVDRSGLAVILGQHTGWGAVLFDYDNDGHADLFVANGHAHHEYPQTQVLVRNDGKGRFVDVARTAGEHFQRKFVSRGATWADLDDDGNVDLVVVDTSGPPHLLRNEGGTGNRWIKVDARLAGGRRTAIGARVTVVTGERRQFQDVIGVNGYLSQGDTRAHFGLGRAEKVDRIEVRWPDGTVEAWTGVEPNQILRLEQGRKRE
jgi:enediyne biosynthesis protein E4